MKTETAQLPRLSVVVLSFLMLVPALGLFRVWPLYSAVSGGLTWLCVGFLFAIPLIIKRDKRFRFNVAVFFFLCLIVALAASVLVNSYTYEAAWRWYLVAFIICILALVAASDLKKSNPKQFHNSLAGFLWAGCFIYGLISLLKYYGVLALLFSWAEPVGGRLTGVWGQSNLTTTMCWLGVLASAVAMSSIRQKGLWLGSTMLFGWVLACSASRMSWLMVAGLFALIFVSRLSRYREEETIYACKLLARSIFMIIIMLFLVPPLNQLLQDRLVSFGLLDQGMAVSLVGRDVLHDNARLTELTKVISGVGAFSDLQWMFGVGPGNYPQFSYQADMTSPPQGLVPGTWLHSHNIFSMMLVEFGLFGLIIVLGFVALIAHVALKQSMTLARFFSIGGIGLLFIHSNLEYPLWYFWFLVLFCLLLTNLFEIKTVEGDSRWLKPVVGICGCLMVIVLLVNVGYQFFRISSVAVEVNRGSEDYQKLSFLANDSLMGPYAILRKYRDFAPESANVDWQLREARRMKRWQPRDLVLLREFSLLVLDEEYQEACVAAEHLAYRYPRSAPIMLNHSMLADTFSPARIAGIANCIEKGLAPRGETILSVEQKNKARLSR
ncbi:PglL family O-oligosaccharyltransferase [Marinobacter bohaiensis]|uniref:PglL family O-oligosaccharyltransferase n=1 Tax=Marinobacter bohaiensis TaxID=2201898 RepID=UPI0013A68DDD|nr:Wzy polymerase domain-containing protein [Marinobacter bohaiensis]